MVHKRWQICMTVAMTILCGCSQRADSAVILYDSIQNTEEQNETGEDEELEETVETKEAFPKITVIDTLPAVDESVPRELTSLPSSEINNIVGQKETNRQIKQEDGTFSYEQFSMYNVICHDHDVSFCMPNGGQIVWSGSGVSVEYIGEREREILRELDDKNVVGDDCREFNEGMAKTRQLILEGFLQDEFAKYLSKFPELELEDKADTGIGRCRAHRPYGRRYKLVGAGLYSYCRVGGWQQVFVGYDGHYKSVPGAWGRKSMG